ncbi:endonuclease/Exonuclease/phosphatase [Coniella lustricola]|uniref:Endonuclease/Exonuclease/phosphatase n=1 Tax=Coniella lustricola TaxID=2025994 RepID=A0A2T3AG17_9PEZI|nr:endonuclease/Exonuclease/phosphatase [Coniella lustricola]
MVTTTLTATLPFRHITFNIRYANQRPVHGESLWSVRGPRLCNQLRALVAGHPAAFISLQEALAHQVKDVQDGLNAFPDAGSGRDSSTASPDSSSTSQTTTHQWTPIGLGRDDGKQAGEFSPVFYNAAVWTCERSKTYWLSPTPEKPGSRGWDAVLPRIVTMGQFQHKELPGTRVVVLSTHFDHVGVRAREESARLILRLTDEWQRTARGGKRGRPPVFLGGDFNSRTSDKAYKTITSPGEMGMTDIATLIPAEKRYGNELTYSSFGQRGGIPKRIDFLFVRDPTDIKFLTYGVEANRFDDGVFLSDHRATVADMEIPVKGQRP